MLIEVVRLWETPLSTCGMMSIDAVFECYTLEPPEGPERIPAGTYAVKIEYSPRFDRPTPHLLNVPGHEYEEIHVGNFPRDSHGCTLVGKTRGVDYIGQSEAAFFQLMEKLPPEFNITYMDKPAAFQDWSAT